MTLQAPPEPREQRLPEPRDYDHSALTRTPEYTRLLAAITALSTAAPYLDEAGLAEIVAGAAIGLSYADQCPRCARRLVPRLTPPSELSFDRSRCLVRCRYVCARCATTWPREHALEPESVPATAAPSQKG